MIERWTPKIKPSLTADGNELRMWTDKEGDYVLYTDYTKQIADLQEKNDYWLERVTEIELKDYDDLQAENEKLKVEVNACHNWYCACGHWNGCNLSTCALCGRTPSESYPIKEK